MKTHTANQSFSENETGTNKSSEFISQINKEILATKTKINSLTRTVKKNYDVKKKKNDRQRRLFYLTQENVDKSCNNLPLFIAKSPRVINSYTISKIPTAI